MTTMTRTYDPPASTAGRPSRLRQLVAGAAGLDTALAAFSLAAADQIAGWLSVSTADVRIAGGVLVVAALTGALTAIVGTRDARPIAAANLVFAAWSLAMLSSTPNALGVVVLAGSAGSAAATAFAELRLAASE